MSRARGPTALADALNLPCGASLKNRLAKAAMSEQLADLNGAPTKELTRLYQRWARGGAGLLITGHVMVDPRHLSEPGNVRLEDDRHLDGLSRWAEAATLEGTHAWVQLNHPGRQAPRAVDPHPVAPSAVPLTVGGGAFARPRALTEPEILELVERFARAARLAQRAGFTGVQVHAAHGYLASQFLSPLANRRDDAWGGDGHRRRRFLLEIVRAVRAEVGSSFPVGVKLNSADFQRGGATFDDSLEVVQALSREPVDLLEISGGTYERAAMFAEAAKASTREREAFFLDFAERARAVATMPVMVTGGFRTKAAMERACASGAVDVIGLARPLAVEPELPRALLEGRAEKAKPVRLGTGLPTLDALLVGSWHQRQLHRLGRGLEPDLTLSRAAGLLHSGADALRRLRGTLRRRGFPPRPRAFITGAGSGLGRGFALALAKRQGRLLLGDVDLERAEETARLVRAAGGEAHAIACDVSRLACLEDAATELQRRFGGLDVLINNAGIAAAGKVGEQALADWEALVRVNLWGAIHGCHVFVPLLKAQGHGFVLNVSAGGAFISLPEMAAYNVTKAAVLSLSETLHGELAPHGIHVTALCPTFVKTNLMETARFVEARQAEAAAAFFRRASMSVEQVVEEGLRALEENAPVAVPQLDGALLWRLKRHLPGVYFWASRNLTGRAIARLTGVPAEP